MERYLYKGIWSKVSVWISAQGELDATHIHKKEGDKETGRKGGRKHG